jgi:hypothetical protein
VAGSREAADVGAAGGFAARSSAAAPTIAAGASPALVRACPGPGRLDLGRIAKEPVATA